MSKACTACGVLLMHQIVCPSCHHVQEAPVEGSPFDLLGMEPDFPINLMELQKKYFDLQRQVHPDQLGQVALKDENYLRASRWSAALNGAYQTLKEPLSALAAFLDQKGYPIQMTTMDSEILMEAFDLQEQVADASYERLKNEIIPRLHKQTEDLFERAALLVKTSRYADVKKVYLRVNQVMTVLNQLKDRC